MVVGVEGCQASTYSGKTVLLHWDGCFSLQGGGGKAAVNHVSQNLVWLSQAYPQQGGSVSLHLLILAKWCCCSHRSRAVAGCVGQATNAIKDAIFFKAIVAIFTVERDL